MMRSVFVALLLIVAASARQLRAQYGSDWVLAMQQGQGSTTWTLHGLWVSVLALLVWTCHPGRKTLRTRSNHVVLLTLLLPRPPLSHCLYVFRASFAAAPAGLQWPGL